MEADGIEAGREAGPEVDPAATSPTAISLALSAAANNDRVAAEANKYAPNWGRLHLKWGEALYYAGKKAEAAKQFVTAAGLNLTAAEKLELAGMNRG